MTDLRAETHSDLIFVLEARVYVGVLEDGWEQRLSRNQGAPYPATLLLCRYGSANTNTPQLQMQIHY